MKKLAFLCLLWTSIFSVSAAQDATRLDSLKNELAAATTDTSRIKIYHLLSLASIPDLDRAVGYEEQALTLATRMNDGRLISSCLSSIGTLYRNQSEYRQAIRYFKKAIVAAETSTSDYLGSSYLELGIAYLRITELDSSRSMLQTGLKVARNSGDRKTEAGIYNSLGNVSKDENNFKAAVEYYLKATDLFQRIPDDAGLTQSLSNVGNVHALMGNYDKALAYAQQSLDIAESINKKSSIAYSNRLLGRIYKKTGKFKEALQVYDIAISTYQSINAKRDAGETYLNKGNIYFELSAFSDALTQYFESLRIVRAISDTANMVYAYSAIGMTYDQINKHPLAFRYLDSASVFSEKLGLLDMLMDVQDALSQIHAEEGNFKSAYQHHLLFSQLRDSLLNIRNTNEAEELEARYHAEKKEAQIKALNAQNELKALQLDKSAEARNYLIGLIGLCIVLLGVIYSRYRIKQKTTRKLEELDEMKSRFFANISHEFRTPLSLILGLINSRIDKGGIHERDSAELEVMARNARRLQSLINQLLDLSKLEAGHMKLNVSKENLRHFFGVTLSSFSSLAEQRGLLYDYTIDNHVNEGFLDHDKIEKIIYNLVSNALKFTDVGGHVHVTVRQTQQALIVEVKDNGMGIPERVLPRIFDRFFQADGSYTRSNEGTGIGLALSKELALLHHGTLTATSKPGEGSCFTLTVPLHLTDYSTDEIASTPRTALARQQITENTHNVSLAAATDNNLPLVLIAEDHPDMGRFIATTLEDHFRVVVTKDGEEGWQKTLDIIPDIVISDLMMPKLDGQQLCQRIKSHEATSHIPVIMLTARADQHSKVQGLKTGADDYLTKPFDAHELRVRVANLIEQRLKLRALFRKEIVLAPKQLQLASPDAAFLEKAIGLLENHYENSAFGVDEFTLEVGLSRMQLHRKLKSLTDKSPGEFIRQFRLERAKQLLSLKGMSVSDVSYRSGFNNLSNFTKVFKEYTGVTPSEFAAEHAREMSQKQV
jgi:signal transduction histidine kinase/DNA-binding response OmpR family regulator/lipopolysaccharide biosynthesis regulator YciM